LYGQCGVDEPVGNDINNSSWLNNHVRINDHSSRKDVTVAQPSIR
jgi:hypothetical protein